MAWVWGGFRSDRNLKQLSDFSATKVPNIMINDGYFFQFIVMAAKDNSGDNYRMWSNTELPPKKRYLVEMWKEDVSERSGLQYRIISGVIRHTSSPEHAIAYFQHKKVE